MFLWSNIWSWSIFKNRNDRKLMYIDVKRSYYKCHSSYYSITSILNDI